MNLRGIVCQPDKVRLRGVQSRHQVVQLILVERRDRLAASLLLLAARVLHFLPGLTGMIGKNVDRKPDQDFVVIGHSVIQNKGIVSNKPLAPLYS